MISYRASKVCPEPEHGSGGREVTHFTEAKLVKMSGTGCAYIELGGCSGVHQKDQGGGGCAFCSKSTRHEHVFPGRVRFDPKEGKYYVSFLQVKEDKQGKKENKNASPPSSLQVIPVSSSPTSPQKRKTGVRDDKSEALRKRRMTYSRIYPLVAYNETEATSALLASISEWTKSGRKGRNKVFAVKVVCSGELVLVRVDRKEEEGEGVEEEGPLLSPCKACEMAMEDSLESLVEHLSSHGLAARLRRLPEPAAALDEEDGALEDPTEYLCMVYDERQDKTVCKWVSFSFCQAF